MSVYLAATLRRRKKGAELSTERVCRSDQTAGHPEGGHVPSRHQEAAMESQVRQNYNRDCEAALNRMVNLELYASYTYLSMEQSHEEREHAEKFLKYQNKRGGRVVLQDIKKPERDEWANTLEAMQAALELEKTVNQALLELHKLATDKVDPQLCDFLESEYLEEQVKAMKQLGDYITNLKRLGVPQNGMGEYLFDKHTLGESS
ncbi:unnamed protein product [Ranitomeya imitator]|uniref:Ferritin n=1 Tax=Ranitomeya imitator TaxID=111125 RepID=A0ABN9KYM3_9NEOB|nr:unnamed protein product [Ranitomeya imitator]